MLERRRVDADHREIRVRIIADELGRYNAGIVQRDLQPHRPTHHVAVREDKAIRRDKESAAGASVSADAFRSDIYHARRYSIHHARDRAAVAIEQFRIFYRLVLGYAGGPVAHIIVGEDG